jgi:protein-tyrosine-phosphatase
LPSEIAAHVRVLSAGTNAVPGVPATPLAVSTVGSRGIDLRGHQSTSLTPELIRESELILGMEPGHVARARELAPDADDRIHLITEQGAEAEAMRTGIHDPIGGTSVEYDDTFNRIRSHLLRWLPLIREAVERREGVR